MSFRKYGGTQFASSHNVVKSNINTTGSFYVTENIGQPNTYINFESDISGNIIIYGDLDVSGNLSVTGDIDCSGNLSVTGDIDCSGNVNIDGDVDINGKLHVQEDIDCSGNVNIDGDVDINGKLHVQEDIDCSGNVNIDGNVTAEYMFLSSGTNYTTAANGVVPKSYVDSLANGLTPLPPCVLCSNVAQITLSGNTQTIDGVTLNSTFNGKAVLINAQGATPTTPDINNGIYIVSSGSWTRATYLTTGDEATGTATFILQGTTYANYRFVCTTGTNTSPVYIGSPVLWSPFEIPYSLGQGLSKYDNGNNTVIQVDSSLNFINFLDNYAGPNAGTINIGCNNPTSLINTINLATVAASGQQSALNWGTSSNSGDLTFRGGTFNLYATGDYNQDSGTIFNTNIDTSKTTGNLNIGTGNSQTGPINLGTGTGAKTITIGSTASTVAINGATTVTGTTTITGGITASGLITANAGITVNNALITANAGIGTTTLTASGLITANNGITVSNAQILTNAGITSNSGMTVNNVPITANAGIGTTTLTASGLITANTLTASGLITANSGIGTTTLQASGLITANAGIGTTTLQASGLITANTLTASGLITANSGLTVTGTTNINNTGTSSTTIGNTTGTTNFTGNVGIGTTNPQSLLDVSGNARIRGRTYFGIDNPGGGADDTAYMEYIVNSGENTCLKIVAQNDPPGGQGDNIALMPSANVGIGTTTPGYTLDVSGNINFSGSLLEDGNPYSGYTQWTTSGSNIYYNSGNVGIGITNPAFQLSLGNTPSPYKLAIYDGGTSNFYGLGAFADNLTFGAGITSTGTPQMVLSSNGYLGIGTTTPQYPLDISGNSGSLLRLQNNLGIYQGGSANIEFWTANQPTTQSAEPLGTISVTNLTLQTIGAGYQSSMTFNVNGNGILNGMTLIGTTDVAPDGVTYTSGANLQINGATYYSGLTSNPMPAALTIATTTGTEQLLLGAYYTSNVGSASAIQALDYTTGNIFQPLLLNPQGGRVGIATTSPNISYTLDVSGGGNFTGYVNISSGLGVTGGLTSNNATTCTGLLTANGGITATVGIGTTTLSASGLITALSPGSGDNSSNVPTTSWVNTAISSGGSKWSSTTNGIYYNSGFVGIKTTNPQYALDVSGNGNFIGIKSYGNSDTAASKAPDFNTNDTNDHNLVLVSTKSSSTTPYSMALGVDYTGGFGYINTAGESQLTNLCLQTRGGGNVGINTNTPAYKLDVNGNVGATSYNTTSDYRIKKDVVTLNDSFTVDKLRPVTYNNTKLDKQDIGLIAHEVQEIYPFLVTGEKDGENFQTVNYTGLIGILIKEIQELKERVKKLEEK